MKQLLVMGMMMVLATSAFAESKSLALPAPDKTVYKIADLQKGLDIVIVSKKRFATRTQAQDFCKTQNAQLAPFELIFGVAVNLGELNVPALVEAIKFDFSELTKAQNGEEFSGIVAWTDDAEFQHSQVSGGNAELLMIYNGRGSDVDALAIGDINAALAHLGGEALTLPAICVK